MVFGYLVALKVCLMVFFLSEGVFFGSIYEKFEIIIKY